MIIADTNVVSEFMKDAPDLTVLEWAETLDPTVLSICAITVEEIEHGIRRLPAGKRRTELGARWKAQLAAFVDTIVPYDTTAAQATADLLVHAETSGRPISHADAQIAGTCLSRGHQLATRNARDFSNLPSLTVINPFEAVE